MMLFLATGLGLPVSTTHTITGSIVGVGSVQKLSAVRWGVAGDIVRAWIFTIPCSAFVAVLFDLGFGVGRDVGRRRRDAPEVAQMLEIHRANGSYYSNGVFR